MDVPLSSHPLPACRTCGTCPWLEYFGLPSEGRALSLVESGCRYLRLERGESLYVSGERERGLDMVQDGLLQSSYASFEGREVVTELLEPSMVYGLQEFFGHGAGKSRITALKRTTLCHVPASVVQALMVTYGSAIHERLLRSLAERARMFEERLRNLALKSVKARFAAYLAERARGRPTEADGSIRVRLPAHQGIIAAYLGTSREEVSRALRALREDGIVTKEGGVIRILRPRALLQIA